MLILHLAYEQNSIYLWGEVSFDRLRRPKPGEDGYAALPWGAKPAELRAALKETGVRNARKTNELATHIYILLPREGRASPRRRTAYSATRRSQRARRSSKFSAFPRFRSSSRSSPRCCA